MPARHLMSEHVCILTPMKLDQRITRMGRPRLPANEARSNRIVTFVTNSELEHLKAMMARNGETLSSVCHRILSKSLKQR